MAHHTKTGEPEVRPDHLPNSSGYERTSGPSAGPVHADDQGHEGGHHIVSVATYAKVIAALTILLVITLVAATPTFDFAHQFGPSWHWVNIAIAVGIAVIKAVLIILFFMHVKYSSKLTWIFVAAAFVFVAIMFGLTLSDYQTRGWLPDPGKQRAAVIAAQAQAAEGVLGK